MKRLYTCLALALAALAVVACEGLVGDLSTEATGAEQDPIKHALPDGGVSLSCPGDLVLVCRQPRTVCTLPAQGQLAGACIAASGAGGGSGASGGGAGGSGGGSACIKSGGAC